MLHILYAIYILNSDGVGLTVEYACCKIRAVGLHLGSARCLVFLMSILCLMVFRSSSVVAFGKLDKNCSTFGRVITLENLYWTEAIGRLQDSAKVVITSWNSQVTLRVRTGPTCLQLVTFVGIGTRTLCGKLCAITKSCSRPLHQPIIENFQHGMCNGQLGCGS